MTDENWDKGAAVCRCMRAREKVNMQCPLSFSAALEESYQNFQEKKEAKDEMFRDAQAELSGLIRIVEDHNNKLRKVLEREREAEDIIQTYPSCITSLQAKVLSAKELFIPSS